MERKVVIITGANNGIGFHMAQCLLDDQYRVAGFDLSGENLSALQTEHPDDLRFHRCDVTDEAQVEAAVKAVMADWGRIDILVNNACLAIFKPFEEKSLDETRQEFDVNYFGYVHTIKAVLPHMKAQGHGIIHNVSSGVGITGFPGIYGYASAKGAIEALSRTLAIELEPYGIRVSLMHPPLTRTRSASPLGVPEQIMSDPADVGRGLAKKIESTRAVITPDVQTALGLFVNRHFPGGMGKMLAKMTQRAKEEHG